MLHLPFPVIRSFLPARSIFSSRRTLPPSSAALPAAIALMFMVLRLMPRSPQASDDINSSGIAADGATLDEIEATQVTRGLALGPGLSWWSVLFVGFLGCVGMFFAHPGALFALGIWALIGAIMLSARLVVWSRAHGLSQLRRSLLWLLLGWSVVLGLWAAMNLVPGLNGVRDFNWPELMTMNQAMGQALTLSTVITKAHWVLGAATLWGFYRLLTVPRLRWLLVSHVFLIFLYMLAAGSPTWLARELTGFWFNDAQRVASLIPMTAVPLAALGITSAADVLARFVSRTSVDVLGRPLSSRRALGIAALGMLLVGAVVYPEQIGQGAAVLQDRYKNPNYSHRMVTADEQVLYEKLASQLPAGQTVLGSPFTGAQFSAIWSGHSDPTYQLEPDPGHPSGRAAVQVLHDGLLSVRRTQAPQGGSDRGRPRPVPGGRRTTVKLLGAGQPAGHPGTDAHRQGCQCGYLPCRGLQELNRWARGSAQEPRRPFAALR